MWFPYSILGKNPVILSHKLLPSPLKTKGNNKNKQR